MQVRVMNPEVLTDLYKNHGEFACVCYNTSEKYAERVGESCEKSGHMSGSRCEYIKFKVSDVDRGTAEQCLRHEIGTYVPFEMQDNYSFSDYAELVKHVSPDQIVKNMASFRYINKDGFSWATPASIQKCPVAKERYDALMKHINEERMLIRQELIDCGCDAGLATQDANFVLPRATETEFVIGFTPEAFLDFCHKRLCMRAQEFIRTMAVQMKREVARYNERFAKECVPHCQHLLWCPEGGHSCGLSPTKDKMRSLLERGKGTTS